MKIAQVSPLFESVPPKGYGGTERVVSYLTEELVSLGHDVTLFATADSRTAARLVPVTAENLRAAALNPASLTFHTIQLGLLGRMADSFDVIHFHTDYLQFPMARHLVTPHVTTLHGRLDLPELVPLYRQFPEMPLVSISNSQRVPLPWVNWCATVYHGLPADLYSFNPDPGDYCVFLGRISPEKRPDRAIDIAVRAGLPLYIAAKVDPADLAYFKACIEPLLDHPLINFIGEVCEAEKHNLLANARALLFPIDWPEPFGLVMIEAFACGTPVIAYGHGSVPEIISDGVTGFVVNNQEQALEAVQRIGSIDRRACRDVFERRFTARHMAQGYLRLYEALQVRSERAFPLAAR
jgi:glycosyltransferase involved in cell wall biosynthesis